MAAKRGSALRRCGRPDSSAAICQSRQAQAARIATISMQPGMDQEKSTRLWTTFPASPAETAPRQIRVRLLLALRRPRRHQEAHSPMPTSVSPKPTMPVSSAI